MRKNGRLSPLRKAGIYLLFLFFSIIILFPFYWILNSSLKTKDAIYAVPTQLFPHAPTLDNYWFALQDSGVLQYSLNSILISGVAVLLTLAVSILAVYPLTRMRFAGKRFLSVMLAATQVFPMVVTIIPLYIFYRSVHLYNTFSSLILTYTAICTPIAIVLLAGHFRDVPKEMEESAVIDGCTRFGILFRIFLPLCRPGILAGGVYLFLTNWQEYLAAVSLISDRSKYTLTLGLTLFQTEHSTNWGALMATAVILAVPAILLFLLVERYFIDSLAGSIKE